MSNMKQPQGTRKLTSTYKKMLINADKELRMTSRSVVESVIIKLKFMRDHMILSQNIFNDKDVDIKVTTMTWAISEYFLYRSCLERYFYYDSNSGEIKWSDEFETKQEATEAASKEMTSHWKTFLSLIQVNYESWFVGYDTKF